MIINDAIPMGNTYDADGNILTYKSLTGNWEAHTYDCKGRVLSYKNSNGYYSKTCRDVRGNIVLFTTSSGYWCEQTYNSTDNELTRTSSNGYWRETTYNDAGHVLTLKDSYGINEIMVVIDIEYTLYRDVNTKLFKAGCRKGLTLEEALAHWDRTDARAILFTKALKELT
jgi:hypothetical protein